MAAEIETGAAETRWELNRIATKALIGGWGLAALGAFLVGEVTGARFLDLPIGAFVAGQGAFVSLVVVGVRIAAPGER